MPSFQFVYKPAYDILYIEKPVLPRYLRIKHHVKKHVSEFLFDMLFLSAAHRLYQLPGFFLEMRNKRGESLLFIPQASPGAV